ncbi:hypothetical protein BT96DRAFT_998770 [Gymnopus androsaceus JB14]|uniref:Uncharacterized protein n=1 Tax=Gymnopus androsaceus JB14 TaxID=1447944 RepID=A0A6A4HAI1_9AGAR|nr:hypothetical protein BT96DRAFT_998770 [Gymnopus androsaceus JB14]
MSSSSRREPLWFLHFSRQHGSTFCNCSGTSGNAFLSGSDPSDSSASSTSTGKDCSSSSLAGASSESASALPKRKKGQMGAEEKTQAFIAAKEKSEWLTETVVDYTEKVDEMVKQIAKEQGVTPERIRQLAGQAATIKDKHAVSNWIVLVHIKSKELNADCPDGSKLPLVEIQDNVHKDTELMRILNHDKKRMAKSCEEYEDDRSNGWKAIMQVSMQSAALIVSKCNSLLQIDYVNENTGCWGSSAISGFFVRRNIDDFMRKYFNTSIQEMVYLLEDYACTATAMENKKVPTNKMQSLMVEMILSGLREITKVSNLTMSYAHYNQDIWAAQGVMIEGWPDEIDFVAPSKLKVALDIQTLYNSWKAGQAHWRVMTAAEQRLVGLELTEHEPVARAKYNDEDENEADYRPKKSRSMVKKAGVGVAKKVVHPPTKSNTTDSAKTKKRCAPKRNVIVSDDNEDAEWPSKKQRAPKCNTIASDDDDEDAEHPSKKQCISKRKSIVSGEGEQPSKSGGSKSAEKAGKKAAASLAAKEKKIAELKKRRKVHPGSKVAIAEVQFAESRLQLEEMHQDRAWADSKEAQKNDELDE